MPVEELASGFFSLIGRVLGYLLIDIVLEILVKGVGYLIIKSLPFYKGKDIGLDGFWPLLVGGVFWVLIGMLVYVSYTYMSGL